MRHKMERKDISVRGHHLFDAALVLTGFVLLCLSFHHIQFRLFTSKFDQVEVVKDLEGESQPLEHQCNDQIEFDEYDQFSLAFNLDYRNLSFSSFVYHEDNELEHLIDVGTPPPRDWR